MFANLAKRKVSQDDKLVVFFPPSGKAEEYEENGSVFFAFFPQLLAKVAKGRLDLSPCTPEVYDYIRAMIYDLEFPKEVGTFNTIDLLFKAYACVVSWDVVDGCGVELGIGVRIVEHLSKLPITRIEKILEKYSTGHTKEDVNSDLVIGLYAVRDFFCRARLLCHAYKLRELFLKYPKHMASFPQLLEAYISLPDSPYSCAMTYDYKSGGRITFHDGTKKGRIAFIMSVPQVLSEGALSDGLPRLTHGAGKATDQAVGILLEHFGKTLPLDVTEKLLAHWDVELGRSGEKPSDRAQEAVIGDLVQSARKSLGTK